MTEDRITDNLNPTDDDLREWGYDLSRCFMEQDEDLIILNCCYLPVLLELADDPDCPKGGDVQGMVMDWARCAALRTDDGLVRAIKRAADAAAADGAATLALRTFVQRLVDWRVTPVATDEARALAMARDLLEWPDRESRLLLHERDGPDWHIRMARLFEGVESDAEDLWINAATGRCRYAGPLRVDQPL